jgi:hypothetical protein
MNFCMGDQSDKQFRCGSRRVSYDCGAPLLFENKEWARDFAEFADVMIALLNSRRAAARFSGGLSGDVRFLPTRGRGGHSEGSKII